MRSQSQKNQYYEDNDPVKASHDTTMALARPTEMLVMRDERDNPLSPVVRDRRQCPLPSVGTDLTPPPPPPTPHVQRRTQKKTTTATKDGADGRHDLACVDACCSALQRRKALIAKTSSTSPSRRSASEAQASPQPCPCDAPIDTLPPAEEETLTACTAEQLMELIGGQYNNECGILEEEQSPDEVLANEDFQEVDVVVCGDSGCSDHIMNRADAPGYRVEPSEASKRGKGYVAADGGRIENEGEAELNLATEKGQNVKTRFQFARVTRPLMSIAKICDADNTVLFSKKHAIVKNAKGQEIARFERRGMLYLIKFRLKAPGNGKPTGFRGPGQ